MSEIKETHFTREIQLAPAIGELAKSRVIPASFSSEVPITRSYGNEVLLHNADSIDLSRVNSNGNKLPLLAFHDDRQWPIGFISDFRLDAQNRVTRGLVNFADTPRADEPLSLYRQGVPLGLSIGYDINWDTAKHDKESNTYSFRWIPMEVTVCPIAADHTIGLNRSITHEVPKMTDETKEVVETSTPPPDLALVPALNRARAKAKAEGANEAITAERQRVADLDDLFQLNMIPRTEIFSDIRTLAINQGWHVEATRKYLMEVISSEVEPVFDHTEIVADGDMGMQHAPPSMPKSTVRSQPQLLIPPAGSWNRRGLGRIEVTRDATETAVQSIEQALLVRCGIETDKAIQQEARERGFAGLTYVEMGRQLFEVSGQQGRIAGLDKHGVAKAMLTRAGPMTASDFTGILANVATKIAKKGYAETPTTYQEWCNIGYLPDFKAATIPGLGAFSDLDQIPTSGGPYFYGTFGDNYETATLGTYGKLFGISRHALVNDDLNLFSRTGIAMGAAAARKVNALAYAVLTSPSLVGQTMTEDGQALFYSGHGNLVANGSGAAPSVTTLNAAELAMAIQKSPKQTADSSTVYLNVAPGHLIVPPALKATALVLNESMWDPAGTTAAISRRDSPNIWRGRLKVTSDPLVIPAEGWFLAAPQGNMVIDTVTVFFLEGSGGEPYTEEQTQFDSDGISYKVRIDAVARALDYRGLYYNDGN